MNWHYILHWYPSPDTSSLSFQIWMRYIFINSLVPGRFEWNFRYIISKVISVIGCWGISCEIAIRWLPLDLTDDDESTLVQVMARCRKATSHYPSQCWPRSMSPYVVIRRRWVKCFGDPKKLGKLQNEGSKLSNPHPCSVLKASIHWPLGDVAVILKV